MRLTWMAPAALAACVGLGTPSPELAAGENIDPTGSEAQFAYAENVGWLNGEPLGDGGPGLLVTDSEVTGWMWGENIGWVSLSCENTAACAAVRYGIYNDTTGRLFGFAWSENAGWINFAPAFAGVWIDPNSGEFTGHAWGENIGWISFASTGPVSYKVITEWQCPSNPGLAGETFEILHEQAPARTTITWPPLPAGPRHYNTYRGGIPSGFMGGRPFPYDHGCFESDDDEADGVNLTQDAQDPPAGTAFYYLVTAEGACEGGLGTSSDGRPRPNFNACPTPP